MISCALGVSLLASMATLELSPSELLAARSTTVASPITAPGPRAAANPSAVNPSAVVSDELSAPPGLVLVPAGRYEIGTSEEFLVELIRKNEGFGNTLASEHGGEAQSLPDFYLMPTEVTNEQYAPFLRATGYRPPQDWADPEALLAAQTAHNEAFGEKVRAAREAGLPTPDPDPFDAAAWFGEQWAAGTVDWQIPKGRETHPVTWIDHAAARSYAEWAGLRLMTEFEFQAAARGRGNDDPWPWGEEWDPTKTVCLSRNRSQMQPAGSTGFATETGLHDLVGNVWEWTDSPYVAYEDFEPLVVEFGKGRGGRTETFVPEFDPNDRVVVGGSADFDEIATRIGVRRRTERSQRTAKLGFRCAATPGNAHDRVAAAIRNLRGDLRGPAEYAPEGAIAFHRWQSSPGTAEIENYAVIEGYEHLAIAPLRRFEVSSVAELSINSLREGPLPFGLLTTSVPLVQPPLEPGTYKLSWRGKGQSRGDDEEGEEAEDEPEDDQAEETLLPYDVEQVNLLITDAAGEVRAVYDGSDVDVFKADDEHPSGKLELTPWVAPKSAKGDEQPVPVDSIDVTVDVPSGRRGRVVRFVFGLEVAAGTIDRSWIGVDQKGDARRR